MMFWITILQRRKRKHRLRQTSNACIDFVCIPDPSLFATLYLIYSKVSIWYNLTKSYCYPSEDPKAMSANVVDGPADVDIGAAKNASRDDRLVKMRKANEEVLRKKLENEAREKCASAIESFAECGKRESIMVVFNCRKENRAMSDCMAANCNEPVFEEFLKSHGFPLPAKPEPWYSKYI